MRNLWHRVRAWFLAEPVLVLSALLALVSMAWVPPTRQYLTYIDCKTLACLFCLMAAVVGLQRERVLERAALVISMRVRHSRALVLFLVFACFFLAMLVTNDVALITLVPITLAILSACGMGGWSAFVVVLQTIAANIGSSLTPIGNPQNLYLFSYYGIPLPNFLLTMLPVVLVGGVLLAASCLVVPVSRWTPAPRQKGDPLRRRPILVYGALFLLSVAAVFDWLPYGWAVAAVVLTLLVMDRGALGKVDYSLLATFVCIFVFVGNLGRIGPIHAVLSRLTQGYTLWAGILTSQATSNVPAAILLSGFTDHARELLLGVNIGGLGTLIASMASVISYKLYTVVHKGESLRYLRLFTVWNLGFLAVLALVGTLLR